MRVCISLCFYYFIGINITLSFNTDCCTIGLDDNMKRVVIPTDVRVTGLSSDVTVEDLINCFSIANANVKVSLFNPSCLWIFIHFTIQDINKILQVESTAYIWNFNFNVIVDGVLSIATYNVNSLQRWSNALVK